MSILTYEEWQFGADSAVHGLSYKDFVLVQWARRGHKGWPLPWTEAVGAVAARINDGLWTAQCPAGDGCSFVVSKEQPYFMCIICKNETNGGNWYRIIFPGNARNIEKMLASRPARHTRNWEPGESLAFLAEENTEHGLVAEE